METDTSGVASPPTNVPPDPAPADRAVFDTLFVAGMLGNSEPDRVFASIEYGKTAAVAAENERYKGEADAIEHELNATVASANLAREARERAALEHDALRGRRPELDSEVTKSGKTRIHLLSTLWGKRAEYASRLYRRLLDETRAARQVVAETFLDAERLRLARERELLDVARARRQENEPEYARRAAVYATRLQDAYKQQTDHDAYVGALRGSGITRKVSGFLTWTGYLSFTAFGWFLGGIVRLLHENSAGGAGNIVDVFLSSISSIRASGGIWLALVAIIGLLVMPPIVLVGLIKLVDWGLSNIDRNWRTDDGRKKRHEPKDDSLWPWLDNPARPTRRADLTQLVAKLPMFYAALGIPIALAALLALAPNVGATATGSLAADPWLTVLYTYFGVVTCVALAGLALIYVTCVVEPRQRRLATAAERPAAGRIRSNWEIASVAVALLLSAAVSDGGQILGWKWIEWGPSGLLTALLLATLGALTVAYGMMYRGIFDDQIALQSAVATLEAAQQRYLLLPSLPVDDASLGEFREELDAVDEEIARHWRTAAYWEPPALFSTDTVGKPRRSRWRRWWYRTGNGATGVAGYLTADVLLEPGLLAELQEAEQRLIDAESAIRAHEVREAALAVAQADSRPEQLDMHATALRRQRADAAAEHHKRLAEIERDHAQLSTEARNAWSAGNATRTSVASLSRIDRAFTTIYARANGGSQ